jgi:hypothetical protein
MTASASAAATASRPTLPSPPSPSIPEDPRDGITIPASVLVVVQSGTVTFYDENCRPNVHRAGETFIESSDSPGLAKNTGTGTAVVEATFIVPASTPPTPLRIDDPRPMRCDVT